MQDRFLSQRRGLWVFRCTESLDVQALHNAAVRTKGNALLQSRPVTLAGVLRVSSLFVSF